MTEEDRPVLLIVDENQEILSKLSRDLASRYANQYAIASQSSEEGALDLLVQFKEQGRSVALLFVGCRVGETDGMKIIERGSKLFPKARRILLATYEEKERVVESLNRMELDNYLITPLNAPEDDLYPVVDDVLGDWQINAEPGQECVQIVGFRWSAQAHQVKNFLARNLVPYRWLEADEAPQAGQLLEQAGLSMRKLPVVFFPDGSYQVQPGLDDLSEKVGLKQQAESPFYDLVVVGGGPAGLSAAVYGASEGLQTLLIEAEAPGGQAGQSARIENYLGFPSGLSGNELARRAVAQAQRFGVEILTPQQATGLRTHGDYKLVQMADDSQVTCQALLIATGVSYRTLNVPGEERLTGAGVYYGAVITEAISCQGQEVFILGGGNSAGQAAMYLTRFASRITMLTNLDTITETMSQYLVDQIEESDIIHTRFHSTIKELHGEDHLEAVTIEDLKTGRTETVPTVALFVYIGVHPRTGWIKDLVALDEQGYILTGADVVKSGSDRAYRELSREPYFLESSLPGVFAAGDTRAGSVKRIASSVGEGAMAVTLIHQYLAR